MKSLFNKATLLFIIIIVCNNISFGQQFTTTIKGEIVEKHVDSLYMFKATHDYRASRITIPVNDRKFEYQGTYQHKEVYRIAYSNDQSDLIRFFVEPGEVYLTLYPGEPSKNSIQGGDLTNTYDHTLRKAISSTQPKVNQVYKKMEPLKEKGQFYSDSAKVLRQKLTRVQSQEEKRQIYFKMAEMNEDHSDKTPKAKELALKVDSLIQKYYDQQSTYINDHTTLVSYYMLYEYLLTREKYLTDFSALNGYYEKHAKAFPNHPYTSIIKTKLEAMQHIKVGSEFIDFQAPDLDGNRQQLSNLIDGKITLLNLWASWCGSCISKSRDMIPIYKKYNGEDFTIIGVAREFNNITRLEKALQREEFPWYNLVDLDDEHNIWLKYNIPFSGGGMFLIDREGKILAINPTAKEVERILISHL